MELGRGYLQVVLRLERGELVSPDEMEAAVMGAVSWGDDVAEDAIVYAMRQRVRGRRDVQAT